MKRTIAIMTVLMLALTVPSIAEESRVTPGESFYGYVNQDYFNAFDSGIEGTWAEPVYGELIAEDPELIFKSDQMSRLDEILDGQVMTAAEAAFQGEGAEEPDTPAQRVHDLYDSMLHAAEDHDADDARFLTWAEMLTQANDPAEFLDAVKYLYWETGVNVLYSITAAQERETNLPLPKVRMAAPTDGLKVALAPDMSEVYGSVYCAAMSEFARCLGLETTEADIELAWELQCTANPARPLVDELEDMRKSRSKDMDDPYTPEDYQADCNRLDALYPDVDTTPPKGLNAVDAQIYSFLVYNGMMDNIALPREDLSADLIGILEDAGFSSDRVIVPPDALSTLTEVTEDNLTALKLNAVMVLSEELSYVPDTLSEPLSRIKRAAKCAMWGGDDAPADEAEISDDAMKSQTLQLLFQDQGLLWAEKYYDDSMTERVAELTERIFDAYIRRIEHNDWLTRSEKDAIIRKLNGMVRLIGVPDATNCVFPEIIPRSQGGSLLVNTAALKRAELQKYLNWVNIPGYDRHSFDVPFSYSAEVLNAATGNAGNNIAYNTIVIPAGFIAGMADPEDDAHLLATIGFVIAHEIGHAFDATGSLHNEVGAFENWWTEASRDTFHEIATRFEAYYHRFPIAAGRYQDFNGNMQENMADFAGMTAILDVVYGDAKAQRIILEKSTAMVAAVGSAAVVAENIGEYTDAHAYPPVRMNAIISAMDCFYELYDIGPGDPMYTAPEDRLQLW